MARALRPPSILWRKYLELLVTRITGRGRAPRLVDADHGGDRGDLAQVPGLAQVFFDRADIEPAAAAGNQAFKATAIQAPQPFGRAMIRPS